MPTGIESSRGEIPAQLRFKRLDTARYGTARRRGMALQSLQEVLNPVEIRRGLPGDREDLHSRYIEAAVAGIRVGCLYLPNGNPAPGPKFDYKLAWFQRLHRHGKKLLASGHPSILAGDYNVMPTDLDVYAPERWREDALFRPEVRKAYADLVKQGWTDALRELNPDKRIYTFWEVLSQCLRSRCGAPHRSLTVKSSC